MSEEDEGTPKEIYYRAAQLGASYQGRASNKVAVCARFYPTCPHNAEQLIHIFVTEDIQTNEIDTNDQPADHLQPPQSSARLPFYQVRQPAPAVTPSQSPLKQTVIKPVHQQTSAVKASHQQARRPVVAVPVTPLRQRFVASPAA